MDVGYMEICSDISLSMNFHISIYISLDVNSGDISSSYSAYFRLEVTYPPTIILLYPSKLSNSGDDRSLVSRIIL